MRPDIYTSRANRAMLEKEYTKLKENKIVLALPIMRYLHVIHDEGCLYASLPKSDPSRLGEMLKGLIQGMNIDVKTFYETRGIEPAVNKPDFSLNRENLMKEYGDTTFVVATNTAEYTYIDPKTGDWPEAEEDYLTTAIYTHDNGNKSADKDEILLESYDHFMTDDGVDRIAAFFHKYSETNSESFFKFSSFFQYIGDDILRRTLRYYGEREDDKYY